MSSENSLKSIAQRTGVSISTVSRVLNGKHEQYRISPRTVKRVLDEAKRIDYKPSLVAQSLRTRKSYTIGLLIPSIDNPYFAHIASEIVLEARRYNYTIILLNSLEDEKDRKGVHRDPVSPQHRRNHPGSLWRTARLFGKRSISAARLY